MNTPPPTFENLAYGGGWTRGNKEKTCSNDGVPAFFARDISVASINYRHTDDTPFPGGDEACSKNGDWVGLPVNAEPRKPNFAFSGQPRIRLL